MMKERPILMSAPMVRAILEGRKTQTRRIVKPQPVIGVSLSEQSLRASRPKQRGKYAFMGIGPDLEPAAEISLKPFAFVGDQLWVKETFSTDFKDHYPHDPVWYRADGDREVESHSEGGRDYPAIYSPESKVWVEFRWKPSIFMPRALSRITLEITNVRVERLQDISDEDAIAEGIARAGGAWASYSESLGRCVSPVASYRTLWESINGKGSWDANPWVWIVEFKHIKP